MRCADPQIGQLITLYEFGALSDDDRRKFEAHLLSCDYCFQSLYELAPVIERIQEEPQLFLPALVHEPRWTKIKQKIASLIPDVPIRRPAWVAIPIAAAALVLVFVLIWPAPELSELARVEPVPYRSLQVKTGASVSDAERLFEAGMAAYVQKDYPTAAQQLAFAVGQDSANASFHFYLGLCYLLSNRVDVATVHLQKAVTFGGNSVLEKAYWYLGNAWLLMGKRDAALEAFRQLVAMEGDYQYEAEEMISKIEKLPRK